MRRFLSSGRHRRSGEEVRAVQNRRVRYARCRKPIGSEDFAPSSQNLHGKADFFRLLKRLPVRKRGDGLLPAGNRPCGGGRIDRQDSRAVRKERRDKHLRSTLSVLVLRPGTVQYPRRTDVGFQRETSLQGDSKLGGTAGKNGCDALNRSARRRPGVQWRTCWKASIRTLSECSKKRSSLDRTLRVYSAQTGQGSFSCPFETATGVRGTRCTEVAILLFHPFFRRMRRLLLSTRAVRYRRYTEPPRRKVLGATYIRSRPGKAV